MTTQKNCDKTNTAVLIEFLNGLQLAVMNARDVDTLRELIGDATERALAVARGEELPHRLKGVPPENGRVPLYDVVSERPR